jgi:hypothetical protein
LMNQHFYKNKGVYDFTIKSIAKPIVNFIS